VLRTASYPASMAGPIAVRSTQFGAEERIVFARDLAERTGFRLPPSCTSTPSPQEGETMRKAPTQRCEAVGEQRWFDWAMAVLSAWLLGGAFVDGWAHTHGKVDTTFFTPWHAALYTGFLAVAGALVGALVYQRARRGTWQHDLSPGYNLALLG